MRLEPLIAKLFYIDERGEGRDKVYSTAAMSIFEYDREWEEELLRKEEFEAGREEERKNTEKERRRADSEKLRADNAERELLYLKEKLALLEGK